MKKWPFIIASLGGVGYLHPGSGTWGSLASGLLLYFWWPAVSLPLKIMLIVLACALGSMIADRVQRISKTHDPYFFVIDEFIGMMIVTIMATDPIEWFFAFLIFRLFDILKPWPASWCDKRKAGWACIGDDVIAAIYALIVWIFYMPLVPISF